MIKVSTIRNFVFIVIGIFSAGLGLKGFLLKNEFIDGGVTGISMLISNVTGLPLSLLIALVNAPFIVMGYFQVSKQFAFKTLLAIAGLALVLNGIPYLELTKDKLLISVFGGFFLGLGIGFAVRGGCVIDGTEVLALYITRRVSILTIGDVILILNIIIFSVAVWVLSLETALYSMLTYLAASKTVDFVIEGIEEYIGVTIVSEKSDLIRLMIIEKIGRGVTIFNGKRGYGKRGDIMGELEIVFTVVTRLEISRLLHEIERIDAGAFVVQHSINDTRGGMIKKRPLH